MRVLVTGGAGYIGSHVVKVLGEKGHEITILDNLSTGHRKAVTYGDLVEGDLADKSLLESLFEKKRFEAVLHFAGSIVVPESVSDPLRYYHNNTLNSHSLLTFCQNYGIEKFIFSSTAAVYGMPESGVAHETTPTDPINPYGHSKLMTERMLSDLSKASKLRYVALRYFNVSGADLEGKIGQSFPKATHLIKVACETATGKRPYLEVFGTDYPTKDGTCVRDYIHVVDLAEAHLKALEYLDRGGKSEVLNCGYGHGYSVREVLNMVKEVTGVNIEIREVERRPGDSPSLTAKVERIHEVIGWKPRFDDLGLIIKTAYEWEKKRHY